MIRKETKLFFIITMLFFSSVLSAMSFTKVTNKKYNIIYATGKIQSGDLRRFKRVFYSLPSYKQTIVVLSSNGGEMRVGIRLGKFFHNHKIATAVKENSSCVSSCALAFLGGRDLYGRKSMILPPNTKVGFHNFYYKSGNYVNASKVQSDLAAVVDYFSYVDASNKLLRKMLTTKPHKMFWVSNRRHRSYLPTKRISIEKEIQEQRYTNSNYSSRFASKREAIIRYFQKINQTIALAQSTQRHSIALNSFYQDWLSRNLSYVIVKKIKLLKHNRVKVLVSYILTNGKRVYSSNIYKLKRTQYGWRVVSKKIHPLKRYAQLSKQISSKLP